MTAKYGQPPVRCLQRDDRTSAQPARSADRPVTESAARGANRAIARQPLTTAAQATPTALCLHAPRPGTVRRPMRADKRPSGLHRECKPARKTTFIFQRLSVALQRGTGTEAGGMTRVTSHPPWRGSLFHVIVTRVT